MRARARMRVSPRASRRPCSSPRAGADEARDEGNLTSAPSGSHRQTRQAPAGRPAALTIASREMRAPRPSATLTPGRHLVGPSDGRGIIAASIIVPTEDVVGSAPLLDNVGRRPSPVTLPWHELLGRVRRNEGLRYASDPPAVRVVVDVAGAYDGEPRDRAITSISTSSMRGICSAKRCSRRARSDRRVSQR